MKKYNVYKILLIVIVLTIVASYFIPGTTVSYGTVETGTINPMTLLDTILNGYSAMSAFVTTFAYLLLIGAFYGLLFASNKYDSLVNNIACAFRKNRRIFIVLTIFVYGLITMVTNEIFLMLLFVPLSISVIKKLGYSKETSLITTVGSILIGNAGALYTVYVNQMLSLTLNDSLLERVIVGLVCLVLLSVFVLVFDKKPNKDEELKKIGNAKLLPIYIIIPIIFVLIIMGFVNWNAYFGFTGFEKFLESVRSIELFKVSVFNMIFGQTLSAFGNWQLHNMVAVIVPSMIVLWICYRISFNNLLEGISSGIKKAFPYALILVLANIVLINVFSSGIFNTIVVALAKKTMNVTTGTIISIISGLFLPDYTYSTQFTINGVMYSGASDFELLFASIFQAIYNIFLLISPTSILLLMGLKLLEIRYINWIKYSIKFTLFTMITALVIIIMTVSKIDILSIIALVLLVVAAIVLLVRKILINKNSKKSVKKVEEPKKESVKEEVKVEKKEEKKEKKSNTKNSKNKKKEKRK